MRILGKLFAGALLAFSAASAEAAVSVHIDQSAQRMTVRANGQTVGVWSVSTARLGARTPNGTYRPYMLSRNHRSSLYNWAPMPYSVFFRGNYAIHGTNQVSRLGRPASAGCIRLHPGNARVLYELVQRHGMRNVSIHITGATGQWARANGAPPRATAARQQRRVAERPAQRRTVASQRQRTRAAVPAAAVVRTSTSAYAVAPHYELRGVTQ